MKRNASLITLAAVLLMAVFAISSDWTPAAMDGVFDIQRKTLSAVNYPTTNTASVRIIGTAGYTVQTTSDGYLTVLTKAETDAVAGNLWMASDYDSDVDIAAPKQWGFTLPTNATARLRIALGVSGSAVVNLIEGATVTNGTKVASFNLLRSSADAPVSIPYYDTTYGNGTNIVNLLIGSAATGIPVGGVGHDRLEWFLDGAACTNYVLKVTSVADNNTVSMEMTWMEVSGL